jgi:predicted nucleic acid-binding protein
VTDGLADTTVFMAHESGRSLRAEALPDRLAVSVVTIGELRAGVLAAADLDTRARRLATLTSALALDPVPVDERVTEAWARLRVALRDLRLQMPVNDSGSRRRQSRWVCRWSRRPTTPSTFRD